MKVSRRNLLKVASASAVLAGQPAGGLLSAAAGSGEAAAAGELFAVVSPGKAWTVCGSYHEAYHQANLISHSNIVQTAHVRCSPAFAEQVKSGSLKSFVEVDGWAVTGREAEIRGFDFLRNAVDRARARSQLLTHYQGVALDKVNAGDERLSDVMWYSETRTVDGAAPKILAVAETRQDALADAVQQNEDHSDIVVHRCTARLGGQLRIWLEEGGQLPGILKQADLHISYEEYADRIDDDPMFRLAALGLTSHSSAIEARCGYIAYDRADNWIYGVGGSRDAAIENAGWAENYSGARELLVVRASDALCRSVMRQGLELPVFWTRSRGVARHESELRKSQVSDRRRVARPPRPQWKR